jgi:hypothetical protein
VAAGLLLLLAGILFMAGPALIPGLFALGLALSAYMSGLLLRTPLRRPLVTALAPLGRTALTNSLAPTVLLPKDIEPDDLVDAVACRGRRAGAGRALRSRDLLMRVGAPDDAGVVPRRRPVGRQGVGDDRLVDGVVRPRDLPLHRPGIRIVGDQGPVALEPLVRPAAEQQRVGGPQPLGVVLGEPSSNGRAMTSPPGPS